MTGIEITHQALNEQVDVLEIVGEIDIHTAPRVQEAVERVAGPACRRLLLDLDRVPYIDSSGLVVLINALKRMQSHQGEVAFVCTNPHLIKVFDLTGLSQVMRIHPTTEAAVLGFAPVG